MPLEDSFRRNFQGLLVQPPYLLRGPFPQLGVQLSGHWYTGPVHPALHWIRV